jgi:predicted Zn-dependent protease
VLLSAALFLLVRSSLHAQDSKSLQDELKAAASAESAGQYEQAARLYQQALSSPSLPNLSVAVALEARTRLATDYFLLHRYQQSLNAVAPLTSNGSPATQAPAQAWLVDGLDRLELGQLSGAEASLRKTLTLNPDSGTARLALGDAFARDGRLEDASKVYEEQTQRTPSQPDAWYKLGLAYAQLATQVAKGYGEKHPDDPVGQLLSAEGFLDQGDDLAAARALFRLLHQNPTQPQVNADLGAALVELAYPKAGEDHFRRELAQNAECPEAQLGVAETATLGGDWAQVASALENLNRSHPRQLKLLLELQPPGTLRDAWRRKKIDFSAPFAESPGGALWKAWLEGADPLPAFSSSQPAPSCAHSAQAESTLGIWLSENCYETLQARLSRKAALSRQERLKLAEADFRLGHSAAALRSAQEVLRADPSNGWAAYWISQSYGMLAQDCFAKVTSQNPDSARVHEMLAHYWTGRHYYPRAKDEYLAAIKMAPELPDLHLGLATVEMASSEWQEAETELENTLQLAPGSNLAEYELGDAYLQQQRCELAIEHLKKAINDPSLGIKPRLDLADAEVEAGQVNQAVEDLTAIAGQDRDGQVQYRLAKLYRKLGDKQREREALLAFRQLQSASMEAGSGELLELDQEREASQQNASRP